MIRTIGLLSFLAFVGCASQPVPESPPPSEFHVDEKSWQALQASEAYQKSLPIAHAYALISPGSPSLDIGPITRTVSMAGKCVVDDADILDARGNVTGHARVFRCGLIDLGGTAWVTARPIPPFMPEEMTHHLEQGAIGLSIEGSLFPMVVGARESLHYRQTGSAKIDIAAGSWQVPVSRDCEVIEKLAASVAQEDLPGSMWKVHCEISKGDAPSKEDFFFLEYLQDFVSLPSLTSPQAPPESRVRIVVKQP